MTSFKSKIKTKTSDTAKIELSCARVRWSSDINEKVRAYIRHNFAPRRLYKDMAARSTAELPSLAVDGLYVAGFPCQPFSRLGLQQGWDDPRSHLWPLSSVPVSLYEISMA